jgi:hypothetical protein
MDTIRHRHPKWLSRRYTRGMTQMGYRDERGLL